MIQTWFEPEAIKGTLECSIEPVTRVDEWIYEEFKETQANWFEKDETLPKGWKDGDLHAKGQGN